MTRRTVLSRQLLILTLASCLSAYAATAQDFEDLTRAYPDSLCGSCATWNTPQEPFQIHHNSYYVGTRGLTAILIASDEGHVLLDAALPNSAPLIMANIQSLGFQPSDIALIVNSHVHYDHAGGIAAFQAISGARVAASPASAPVLERGRVDASDPQYGLHLDFPAIPNVERFAFGDTLRVGDIALVPHATAGHTPGGTTWSWQSCEGTHCLDIVYGDSQTPVSADGFRYTDSATYPTARADFERGFRTLEQLSCDILITTHPGASSLWQRLANGPEGLLDDQACIKYAASARLRLVRRLRMEADAAHGN